MTPALKEIIIQTLPICFFSTAASRYEPHCAQGQKPTVTAGTEDGKQSHIFQSFATPCAIEPGFIDKPLYLWYFN